MSESALLTPAQEEGLFSISELETVKRSAVPDHVAVIMDGNRRWSKKQHLSFSDGHTKGAQALLSLVEAAIALGVSTVTAFAFSTENWKRSPVEVRALMKIFKHQLSSQRERMVAQGVRLHVIGDTAKLPSDLQDEIDRAIEATKEGSVIDLILALNYGGRDELTRAVRQIAVDCTKQQLSYDAISEGLIEHYLDTAQWSDPQLLIRTSGEFRVSNFMLWQIAYAEVVVTDVLWPDFSPRDFLAAIMEYQQRELRYGK